MKPSAPPQRTCIGCRRVADQGSLMRLTRLPDGEVAVLMRGPGVGRSAYVCPDEKCINSALAKGRLNRAFRLEVSTSAIERLRAELECKRLERRTV